MSEHVDGLVIGADLRPFDAGPGVVLAGDHRETPSQQGAVRSGRRSAEAILRSLR